MYFCGLRGLNSPEYAINSMYINSKEKTMSFKIFPNVTGEGSVFNQISGPLSSLYNPSSPPNLVYPSDLASNPAMCHAIQFSIYDYTTTFEENRSRIAGDLVNGFSNISKNSAAEFIEKAFNVFSFGATGTTSEYDALLADKAISEGVEPEMGTSSILKNIPSSVAAILQAPTYKPKKRGENLATISLYMPDSLNISHDANYSGISMTDTLGIAGVAANAYSDTKNLKTKDAANFLAQSGYGRTFLADTIGKLSPKIGINGENVKDVLKNASGVYTNPQIQLVYKGIDLRTFSLQFTFTPKSPQEAKTTKDIIDTFTFYSVPGKSSAISGSSGQYLTPPQLMSIKFLFLGQNGIAGSISNIFSSALNNLGLNSLLISNPTETIKNGQEAKVMTVSECVLTSVNVDYAPNGWAAFNDGYPVQTTLSLSFQETEIMTKDRVSNPGVARNYNNAQFMDLQLDSEVSRLGGSREDFMTGSNGFGNYGE